MVCDAILTVKARSSVSKAEVIVRHFPANLCLEHDLADELDAVESRMLNLTEIVFYETEFLDKTNFGRGTLDG